MADPREFWNHRYALPGWAYGTEPHRFLREVAGALRGPVLCLGEGEGRNAVYLAERGLEVTAVDLSPRALEKARQLASTRGVHLTCLEADLADFDLGDARWGAIVSIWCHLPPWLRTRVHRAVVRALVPGGHFVLTAYTPAQRARDTGGPRSLELLLPPDVLEGELEGLAFERFEVGLREVDEGDWHRGPSEVVELLAARR